MSVTNPHTNKVYASTTEEGVNTDADGDVEVTLGKLRTIEDAADASASASDGYVANVQSVDGNTVTVRVYESGADGSELAAVTDSDGVTDVHVKAFGY